MNDSTAPEPKMPHYKPKGEWRHGGMAEFARQVERHVQAAVDQGFSRTVTNPEVIEKIGRVMEQHRADMARRAERQAS